jgi:glucose-6-phosphate 1-dehydrogenase
MRGMEAAEPQDIVLIGATGDLARRKLLPALYNLAVDGLLPSEGAILGYARGEISDDEFRRRAEAAVREHSRRDFDEAVWAPLAKRLRYVCASQHGLAGIAGRGEQERRLIYLATPPSVFGETARELAEHGLDRGGRLVIEKPFGYDLRSACELDAELHRYFDEEQIYRIDHYLGKETVQNIMVFRFGNSIFERMWNREAIDHVQITVAESIGLEGRGAFYEEVGAFRDILQNHVLQVVSLLTMEPPSSFEAEAIRDEKVKLLRAIAPIRPEDVVRGQYTRGVIEGEPIPGYREEEGVAPDSETESFAAARLCIDNWRWAGVPFYIRTGKGMPRRVSEVHIQFRDAPISFFEPTQVSELRPNHLTLRLQPDEGITLSFMAKPPGPEVDADPVRMNFSYGEAFMSEPQEAYERLLYDAMDGDRTLFLRSDGVERAWALVEPVLNELPPVTYYPAGSWGPPEADKLIGPREWHLH